MALRNTPGIIVALALACGVIGSCGGEDNPCELSLRDGTCVGVSRTQLCEDEYCTASASCARTFYVKAGSTGSGTRSAPFGQITDVTKATTPLAKAGDCIAVAAGSYAGEISLAGGVSLLGAGADAVTISSNKAGLPALVVQGGTGGLLRGFEIVGEGRGLSILTPGVTVRDARLTGLRELALEVQASSGVVLERVEVLDTRASAAGKWGVGIMLTGTPVTSGGTTTGSKDGSTVTIRASAISGNHAQGVMVHESGVKLEGSLVRTSGHFGVTLQCVLDTDCGGKLASVLDGLTLEDNADVGLLVSGARATVKGIDVTGTTSTVSDARGIEIQEASDVTLTATVVERSQGVGLLLDGGAAARSLNVKVQGCTVSNNEDSGIFVQRQDQGVVLLDGNTVTRNQFSGIGVNDASGVTIKGGKVADTKSKTRLSAVSSTTCGDGIQVLNGSDAAISSIKVETNGRLGVLFDASKGSLTSATISGNTDDAVVFQAGSSGAKASGVTDDGGKAVSPVTPTKPYARSNDLVSNSPVPVPTP